MSRLSTGFILVLFFAIVAVGFYFSLDNFNKQRAPDVPVCAWRLEKEERGILRLEVLGENFKIVAPSLNAQYLLEKVNGVARQLAENTGFIQTVLKKRWDSLQQSYSSR